MSEKPKEGIVEWTQTIVYALFIAVVFRTLVVQPFYIPSGSMKDTLLIGDYLFVNKFAYGYSRYSCPFAACPISGRIWGKTPERGDVVVFRHASDNNDFIKRVIGLPGDTVQLKDGVVYINGTAAPQVDAGTFEEAYEPQGGEGRLPSCLNADVSVGGQCDAQRKIETLPNGVSHDVLNTGDMPQDNTKVFTIPPGNLFVMGDNRDNSADSRFEPPSGVGILPEEYVLGRAEMILFSSSGSSLFKFWTWRMDRFFKMIH